MQDRANITKWKENTHKCIVFQVSTKWNCRNQTSADVWFPL